MSEHIEKSNNLVKADKWWEHLKSDWPNKSKEDKEKEEQEEKECQSIERSR